MCSEVPGSLANHEYNTIARRATTSMPPAAAAPELPLVLTISTAQQNLGRASLVPKSASPLLLQTGVRRLDGVQEQRHHRTYEVVLRRLLT